MKKIFAAAALLLMTAACSVENKPLVNTSWKLSEMEGIPLIAITEDESAFTMEFNSADTMLTGRTNCNRFFGKFQLNGENLSFANMGMTRMACPNMEYEDLFIQGLNGVTRFKIKGDRLTLFNGEQTVGIFNAAPAEKAAEK